MKEDIALIKTTVERLRADLMANTMALQCVMTAMPPDAQRQTLKALAQLSVAREQSAARSTDPLVHTATEQVMQAVDRLYQGLQGAHKARMSQLTKSGDDAAR